VGGGGGKRVWEGEYSANMEYIIYANGKMIPVEIVPVMGGLSGMVKEANSSMIYCKTFINTTMYLHPVQ
jgi:hypothetical protein